MKKYLYSAFLFFVLAPCLQAQQTGTSVVTREDSLSYAVGFNLGMDVRNNRYTFNMELLVKGFQDAYKGLPPTVNSLAIRSLLLNLQSELQKIYDEEMKLSLEARQKLNPTFLGENGKKPGVVTTPSGLQYKIIRKGEGRTPVQTDKVSVHYKGYFVDGKVFDSSYDRGIANEFTVRNVIRGWIEALTMMPEGSKWVLYVPPSLGYNEKNKPQNLNLDDVLIFEVELLKVY